MYKRSLIKLFFKGYHGMLPSTLAEELIIHGDRPSSRLKYGLIVPSFASKYVKNSISYRIKEFNFNVLAPKLINKRSEDFIYF